MKTFFFSTTVCARMGDASLGINVKSDFNIAQVVVMFTLPANENFPPFLKQSTACLGLSLLLRKGLL